MGVTFETEGLFGFVYPVHTPEGWSETPYIGTVCLFAKYFSINDNILILEREL